MDFYEDIKERFFNLIKDKNLLSLKVQIVSARPLTPQEVIGKPERNDFPLLKGKEVMLQADFKGSLGQAFTDMPGNYSAALKEIFDMSLDNNFERAVFVSTLNAVLRYLNYISKTVHCKDKEPGDCAAHLVDYIKERFDNPRIAFIGMQPAMVEALTAHFKIRVVDLDPDNLGQRRCGVLIENVSYTKEIISWADLIIATGTTAVNNTLSSLLATKPIIFYGVTIAGLAYLKGYEQYCFCSH
ncbi:hypothetical protein A2V47_05095 [Candidatus Atribacteria bacterium RBG_19FT_COMBO_35_14]|uniref:Putative heavy-metal chelation domain-containing protein n=1 Tax=Candidatus Sediminicultor quintus TaxID=1797291 RepID=A0A1F5A8N0_9BACT|nr:MAG: hypothetical protein A2V47_05095 [Candidatus Atribacteria bacterium RBG_19FT_COMBO_35_14]